MPRVLRLVSTHAPEDRLPSATGVISLDSRRGSLRQLSRMTAGNLPLPLSIGTALPPLVAPEAGAGKARGVPYYPRTESQAEHMTLRPLAPFAGDTTGDPEYNKNAGRTPSLPNILTTLGSSAPERPESTPDTEPGKGSSSEEGNCRRCSTVVSGKTPHNGIRILPRLINPIAGHSSPRVVADSPLSKKVQVAKISPRLSQKRKAGGTTNSSFIDQGDSPGSRGSSDSLDAGVSGKSSKSQAVSVKMEDFTRAESIPATLSPASECRQRESASALLKMSGRGTRSLPSLGHIVPCQSKVSGRPEYEVVEAGQPLEHLARASELHATRFRPVIEDISVSCQPSNLATTAPESQSAAYLTSSLTKIAPATSSTQPHTPAYSRSPELKVSHKLAERKRRREMKDLFDELRLVISIDFNAKASKWEILSRAIELINSLKYTQSELHNEVAFLRNEINSLKSDLKHTPSKNENTETTKE